METFAHRLAQVLAVVGLVGFIIGVILKLHTGGDWLAAPSGWLRFATTCGILALAGRICWPAEGGANTD